MSSERRTFAAFMEQALYGPDGYYSSGRAVSGRQGDYFTAPDSGAAFGLLLARLFTTWASTLDASPFHLIEVGAGEGVLAHSIAPAIPSSFRYHAIERSPARRTRLQSTLNAAFTIEPDLSALKKSPVSGCIFANELIDAFPVHRVRMHSGVLQEGYVDQGQLVWDSPSTPNLQAYLDRLHLTLPEDYETEINLAMAEWIRDAAECLTAGWIVLIDYGRPARELYDKERHRGTLRAFRNHRVDDRWLLHPGHADLTADVDFTSLALDGIRAGLLPLAFMDLAAFLLPAMSMQSEWSELQRRTLRYLFHPEGLGGTFHVVVFGKNVAADEKLFPHSRLRRLGLLEYEISS